MRTFSARNSSKRVRAGKGAPIFGVTAERNAFSNRIFERTPVLAPPFYFTAIVKQFTSDITNDTTTLFPQSTSGDSRMRFACSRPSSHRRARLWKKERPEQTRTRLPHRSAGRRRGNGARRRGQDLTAWQHARGFEPSTVTVPAGGTVRFINGRRARITSLLGDSVPAGGAAALNAGMKKRSTSVGSVPDAAERDVRCVVRQRAQGTYRAMHAHLTLGMKIVNQVE